MKEWDINAYDRKFSNTIALYRNVKTGEVITALTSNISDRYFEVVRLSYAEYPVDATDSYITLPMLDWEPEYYHFPTGWITPSKLLLRKNLQSYLVGASPNNYDLWSYNKRAETLVLNLDITSPHWLSLDFQKLPLPVSPQEKNDSLKTWGRISYDIYLTPRDILYRNVKVGERYMNQLSLKAPIHQEVSDALRGHEWVLV